MSDTQSTSVVPRAAPFFMTSLLSKLVLLTKILQFHHVKPNSMPAIVPHLIRLRAINQISSNASLGLILDRVVMQRIIHKRLVYRWEQTLMQLMITRSLQ